MHVPKPVELAQLDRQRHARGTGALPVGVARHGAAGAAGDRLAARLRARLALGQVDPLDLVLHAEAGVRVVGLEGDGLVGRDVAAGL